MKSYPGRFPGLTALLCVTVVGVPSVLAQDAIPEPSTVAAATEIDASVLEELVAPIALYPDALIALILPASTTSADIVLAARFLKSGGNQTQIDSQPWDDSVKGLAHYPDVVKWMDENLAWTQRLGEAYLDQPQAVMNAIQRARAVARANGVLKDTQQQRVVVEDEYIRIIPAQRDIIYVPRYDPEIIYVQRPLYYYPDPWLTFGIGFGVGSWLSYDLDWRRCTIWVDHHRHERWRHHRDWRDRYYSGRHGRIERDPHWREWKPLPGRVHPPHRDVHRWRNDIARPKPIPGSPRFDRDRWKDRSEHFGSRDHDRDRAGGNRPGVQRPDRNRDESRLHRGGTSRPAAGSIHRPDLNSNSGSVATTPSIRRDQPRVYRAPRVNDAGQPTTPRVNEAGQPTPAPTDRADRRAGDRRFSDRRNEGDTPSGFPANRQWQSRGVERPRLDGDRDRRRNPSNSNGDGDRRIRPAMPDVRQAPASAPQIVRPQIVRPSTPARSVPQQREYRQPDRVAAPAAAPAHVQAQMRQAPAPQVRAPEVREAPRHVQHDGGSRPGVDRSGGSDRRGTRDRRAD